jgi:hypothetical protein
MGWDVYILGDLLTHSSGHRFGIFTKKNLATLRYRSMAKPLRTVLPIAWTL